MSSEMSGDTRSEKFTKYLESLHNGDDRAALAALRRGLGRAPGGAGEMHRYIVPRVQGLKEWQEDAYYIVAALFGLYPSKNWRAADGAKRETNLGASLAKLKENAGAERRFVALLNSRREDLPEHLRGVISLLKSKEIPVDWAQLIDDINRWDREDRRVQRNWSRAFWNQPAELGSEVAAEPPGTDLEAGGESIDTK